MALIVEDGTGLATAESYVSVVDYKAYHVDRGNATEGSDLDIERRLRLATEYIDIRWGPGVQGDVLTEDQALVFPTNYFTDPLPLPLVRACFEYAFYAVSKSLFIDKDMVTDGVGVIQSKRRVGPIETSTLYSGSGLGAPGRKYPKVSKADALMKMLSSVGIAGVIR